MKCISCGEELVFFKGKLMCKSCNKEWNQLIVDDKEYYDIDLKDSMNAIFAFEYEKLFELLRKQQIYGVLLQIKDIYEVMLKLPVLMTSAIIFNNNEISESDKVILINMINGKNSMGDWNDFASKLKKSMMIRNTPLFKILKDTTSFINSYNCIKWRNETIGHGPTKEIEDDFLYTDIIEKIKCITKFFKDTLDSYDQIPLLLKSEEQTYVLKGYDNAINKKEGSLFVRINDVIYNLDPFIYKVGDGLFFFDNYIASKRYLDIIEYPRGKRDIKYTGKFEDFKDNDQFASKATDELIAQTEVDISSNILNIDDFIEPKYVYDWIAERINNNDKVSFLLFEKGMGKSTLVRSLDPFQMNKYELKDEFDDKVLVRAYYINPTYASRISRFEGEISYIFSRDDNKCEYRNSLFNFQYNPSLNISPKKCFANYLNSIKKTNLYINNKLLFIFDGFDEVSNYEGISVDDFIPDSEDLDDDIFVLVTSRTLLERDSTTERSKHALKYHLSKKVYKEINRDSVEFINLKNEYFDKQILDKVKQRCAAKKAKFVFTIDELNNIKEIFKDENFLYLRQMKEIVEIKLNSLLEIGEKEITLGKLFPKEKNENLDVYFNSLKNIYGEKYYRQFIRLMTVLALCDDYLTFYDMSMLVVGGNITMGYLGFLNAIRMFLVVRRTAEGNAYAISHIENKQYIKSHMKELICDVSLEILTKVNTILENGIDYFDEYDMTILPCLPKIIDVFKSYNLDDVYLSTVKSYDSLFKNIKLDDLQDNMTEAILNKKKDYIDGLINYGEELDLSKKENAFPLVVAYNQAMFYRFIERKGLEVIKLYEKSKNLLSSLKLTDEEKLKYIIRLAKSFLFILKDYRQYDEIVDYLKYYKDTLDSLGNLVNEVDIARYHFFYAFYLTECVDYSLTEDERKVKYKDRYIEAVEHLELCHSLYQKKELNQREKWESYEKYSDLGKAYMLAGNPKKTIEILTEVIDFYNSAPKWYSIKNVYFSHRRLADAYFRLGDIDTCLEKSLKIIETLKALDKRGLLTNKIYLARSYYEVKNYCYKNYLAKNDLDSLEMAKEYLTHTIEYYHTLSEHDQNKVDGVDIRNKIAKSLKEEGLVDING